MTQGKIERYHRSMRNTLLLDNYYSPEDLIAGIGKFADYFNRQRYRESLDNVTPADAYTDRATTILEGESERNRRRFIEEEWSIGKPLPCGKCVLTHGITVSEYADDIQNL